MSRRLGLLGLDALVTYTHDLELTKRVYLEAFDFSEVARSSPILEVEGGQRAVALRAGDITLYVQEPVATHSNAGRFLAKHPPGVGVLVFEVADARAAYAFLEARGATPLGDIERHIDLHGVLDTFSITTPLGGALFRFIERRGYRGVRPGFIPLEPDSAHNRFGIQSFAHVTSTFKTMKPALLWMEHVLGFEPYWDADAAGHDGALGGPIGQTGRSQVMWDPQSGVTFVNLERVHSAGAGQGLWDEADGVEQVALNLSDITGAVTVLQGRGVRFSAVPPGYYDALPERLLSRGIGTIDEDITRLKALGIRVDGDRGAAYHLKASLEKTPWLEGTERLFFSELLEPKGESQRAEARKVGGDIGTSLAPVHISGGPY